MLLEFDHLREQLIRKDKEIKATAKNLIDQEVQISEKNIRLISA